MIRTRRAFVTIPPFWMGQKSCNFRTIHRSLMFGLNNQHIGKNTIKILEFTQTNKKINTMNSKNWKLPKQISEFCFVFRWHWYNWEKITNYNVVTRGIKSRMLYKYNKPINERANNFWNHLTCFFRTNHHSCKIERF